MNKMLWGTKNFFYRSTFLLDNLGCPFRSVAQRDRVS